MWHYSICTLTALRSNVEVLVEEKEEEEEAEGSVSEDR